MARRRLLGWLRHFFLVSPTAGFNAIQSLIFVSSLGYLGYVWHVEQRCPLFPSNRRRRLEQQQQFAESRALTEDPLEAELIKELGKTTFKEWQARGFIPKSNASPSTSSDPLDLRSEQHQAKDAVSAEHRQQRQERRQERQQDQQQAEKSVEQQAKTCPGGSENL